LRNSHYLSVDRMAPLLPVELWDMILAHVVCCPLSASPTDGLINNLKILASDCELYLELERIRTPLRLVSKIWKSIIDHIPFHQSARFEGEIISDIILASRIEYVEARDPYNCACGLAEKCPMAKPRPLTPSAPNNRPFKAFIDALHLSKQDVEHLVWSNGELRILE